MAPPPAPDPKTISRAVKRAAVRRSSSRQHVTAMTMRDLWGWWGLRGSAVGVAALSAWWLVLGPGVY